jgi:hypothetical protein
MFYAFLYLATAKKKASKKAVVIKTKSRICWFNGTNDIDEKLDN